MKTSSDTRTGRLAYERGAWDEAYAALSRADATMPLEPADLWRCAVAASLVGHDDEFFPLMERAHHAHLAQGDHRAAARAAFWLGFRLAAQGDVGPASGWLGRAARLLERAGGECVEHGYMHIPEGAQRLAAGDARGAYEAATRAAAAADRFGDGDLHALALHLQGRARLVEGRIDDGLALLDEAMIGVASGRLSPHVTGLVYCSVIGACRAVYELQRVREWTHALRDWCDRQPGLLAFSGECVAYSAELDVVRGEWRRAIEQATRVCDAAGGYERSAVAAAYYQCGDAYRLLGAFEDAERAYRDAAHLGRQPQPGLALLRAAQGDPQAAVAALHRCLAEQREPLKRARLLPALAEVLLGAGDTAQCEAVASELERIAAQYPTATLITIAAGTRGALLLAEGDSAGALPHLRAALQGWQTIDARYEAARVGLLLADACEALGDREGAALERDGARMLAQELGAATPVAHVPLAQPIAEPTHGLTPREAEVLALVARGASNRAVARTLGISEKTVARHLSNIYGKLGVSSRSAATAFAWKHDLLGPSA